jgi:hypothetical protein
MDRAGSIGNLLQRVPGYRGYRQKEDRRDADRAVRDKIVFELDQRASRVDSVAAGLAAKRDLANVGTVNALARDIRALSTRIRTASYGYGGLFSERDVNEHALAQIQEFDEVLLEGSEAYDGPITALERATPDTVGAMSEAVAAVTRHLSEQFAARSGVVETAQPSSVPPSPPPVSSALDKQEAPTPPPAFDLHDRDAIAILGDNFIVDARIEITGAESFRLFRFEGEPRRWLLAPKDTAATIVLFDEQPVPAEGDTAYVAGEKGSGTGSVIGSGGEQRGVPVTYTRMTVSADSGKQALLLDWGSEKQFFVGSPVHPDDIELFGSTLR